MELSRGSLQAAKAPTRPPNDGCPHRLTLTTPPKRPLPDSADLAGIASRLDHHLSGQPPPPPVHLSLLPLIPIMADTLANASSFPSDSSLNSPQSRVDYDRKARSAVAAIGKLSRKELLAGDPLEVRFSQARWLICQSMRPLTEFPRHLTLRLTQWRGLSPYLPMPTTPRSFLPNRKKFPIRFDLKVNSGERQQFYSTASVQSKYDMLDLNGGS
jgi:hypothetical protein